MNSYLETIKKLIEELKLPSQQSESLLAAVNNANKHWSIVDFKLDRTEKVKRTTAILLEETIQELDQKRQAIEEANAALHTSLEDLKSAQQQLIQSEKMASLGELTAGIAHEIQNPLNFVNNFSELNRELSDELKTELQLGNIAAAQEIADDINSNSEKIQFHGKRAESIVKGMLQHSRTSNGNKEPTDLNQLADEFLRLAYHGIRAKDKQFNATLKTDLDPNLKPILTVSQDIGRAILNLITNAFYAVGSKATRLKSADQPYTPTVTVSTSQTSDHTKIVVMDNGDGIPTETLAKIFQPFFTTKPTGQGTGLGLSMTYDIIHKGHGGTIDVQSIAGEQTIFTITLPNT